MAVIETDLKWYYSEVVSDDDSNGGAMSDNEIAGGVSHNLWPIALSDELAAGSILYRKMFLKNTNNLGEILNLAKVWEDLSTAAADHILMFPGTQIDTQLDFKNYAGKIFACANVAADITAGVSTFDVIIEDPELEPAFQDGDPIRITDKSNPNSVAGAVDLHLILGIPTVVGNVMTITLDQPFLNSYLVADGARAHVLSEVGDLVANIDPVIINSVSGTYDDVIFVIGHDNEAGVEDVFTLDFTDNTNFTCTGARTGVVGSGNTATDFAPLNPAYSKPYLSLQAGGFGGIWTAGDSMQIPTHPASVPVILKRTIPPGTPNLSGNLNRTAWFGEVS